MVIITTYSKQCVNDVKNDVASFQKDFFYQLHFIFNTPLRSVSEVAVTSV